MEKTRYFAVCSNDEIKEFSQIEFSHECLFWLILSDSGRTNTTRNGNTYTLYLYSIVDKFNKPYEYTNNGWVLRGIYDMQNKATPADQTGLVIIDPTGRSRVKNIYVCNHEQDAILEALKLLENVRFHDSWENYDILDKINKMQKEINKLKNELKVLKSPKDE